MNRLTPMMQGHWAMLAFSALVAGSFSLGARVANEIDPAAMTLMRFLIAAGAMGILAQTIGGGFKRAYLQGAWRWLLIGAIYAIYFVLMFEGLKTANSVSAAAVFTLSPVLSALIGWVLLRQVTTTRMALAIAIGAIGALWVIFRGDIAALIRFEVGRGEVIYFLGCVVHAALPAVLKMSSRGEPKLASTTLVLLGGFLALLPYGLGPSLATDWSALSGLVWITLFYVALVASGITAFLLAYASQRLPGAKVMAYTYLVPSWVIGWEIFMGGNPPPALTLGGIALTIVALALLLKDEKSA